MIINPLFHFNNHLLIGGYYKIKICSFTKKRFIKHKLIRLIDSQFVVAEISIKKTKKIIFVNAIIIYKVV